MESLGPSPTIGPENLQEAPRFDGKKHGSLWTLDFPLSHCIDPRLPGLRKPAEDSPLRLAVPNFGQHCVACHACSGALIGYGQPAWFPLGLWESLGNMGGLCIDG